MRLNPAVCLAGICAFAIPASTHAAPATSTHAAPATSAPAAPAISAPAATTSTTSAALQIGGPKKPNEYWEAAVARFRSEETTAPKGGTILLGDSITTRWPKDLFPGDKVVNRGIGGDHIGGYNYYGLIDRMDTSVEALKPKRVFLMIGINDMLDVGPPMENLKLAYPYMLGQLRKAAPDAEIIVQSILPVSKPAFHYMHEPIKELNKTIEQAAKERGMRYVDLYSRFKDENGKLRKGLDSDGIHLSPEGYELWIKVLKEEGLL